MRRDILRFRDYTDLSKSSQAARRAMEYIHLIPDAEVEALRSILGRSVYLLHTRSVDVCGQVVTARDFSLALGKGQYCVIESDWSDTPQGIDYHMLQVSLRDWPKGVARVRDKDGRGQLGNPSTVHLRTPAARLSRIQVLEHREESGEELVHYDQALIFTRADGYRFSLSAQLSIAGGLELSDREQLIEDLLEEYDERLNLRVTRRSRRRVPPPPAPGASSKSQPE